VVLFIFGHPRLIYHQVGQKTVDSLGFLAQKRIYFTLMSWNNGILDFHSTWQILGDTHLKLIEVKYNSKQNSMVNRLKDVQSHNIYFYSAHKRECESAPRQFQNSRQTSSVISRMAFAPFFRFHSGCGDGDSLISINS
jgi:hypothetical protein